MDSVHWTDALPLDVQGGWAPHQQPLTICTSFCYNADATFTQQSPALLLTALLQLSQAIACALALVTKTTKISRIKLLLPDCGELTYENTARWLKLMPRCAGSLRPCSLLLLLQALQDRQPSLMCLLTQWLHTPHQPRQRPQARHLCFIWPTPPHPTLGRAA